MVNLKKTILSVLLSISMVLLLTNYSYAENDVSGNQPSEETTVSNNDIVEVPIDEPVINEPVIDEPVINEPVIDEPVIDEPVIDEPVINEPVIDEPVVDEPVIDEPLSDVSENQFDDSIEADTIVLPDIHFNENNLLLKKGAYYSIKIEGNDYVGDNKKAKKKWTSSDAKIVRVDGSGKVTALKAGEAVVTCTFNEITLSCTVRVYDIANLTFTNNLSKDTRTYINGTTTNDDMTFDSTDSEDIVISIKQNNQLYSAYYLYLHTSNLYPTVTSSNKKVATASCTLSGDSIRLHIDALKPGVTDITVSFAGRKATLKYYVKQSIKADWYDIQFSEKYYTGGAVTNKILLNSLPKGVTYKTVYKNNKEAGTATVTLVGTNSYAGEVSFDYSILPIDITDAKFSCTKSRIFSGEPQAATVSVTKKSTKLKAGRDFQIQYRSEKSNKWTNDIPVNSGLYYVRAEGIGNYTGVVSTTQEYTISKVNVSKLRLNCSGTVKYAKGAPVYPKITLVCESTTISQKTGNTANYKISYSYLQKDGSYSPVDAPTIAGTYMVTVDTYKPNIEPYVDKNGKTISSVSKKFTVK